MRGYGNFQQGKKYEEQYEKISRYVLEHKDSKILFLELGVGRMTPMFIQEPFWNTDPQLSHARYIAINNKYDFLPKQLEDKGHDHCGRHREGAARRTIRYDRERGGYEPCLISNLSQRNKKEADAILIGTSNGLSITEGLHLFADNAAFDELFGDFKQNTACAVFCRGMMAGWLSEEKWAFWARLIHHYCGQYQPTPVMKRFEGHCGRERLLCRHIKRRRSL